jgi:YbgC/YbaW family acyl-CoA thioester hydrolase
MIDDVSLDSYRTKFGTPVRFLSKHRARFVEIDAFGHMNTNHYVAYFTENRFIGHRECLHLDVKALMRFSVAPHIRKVAVEFIRPVLADVEFTVESFVSELASSSCIVLATMKSETGILFATCKFQVVCVDKATHKQTPWPDDFISLYYTRDEVAVRGKEMQYGLSTY